MGKEAFGKELDKFLRTDPTVEEMVSIDDNKSLEGSMVLGACGAPPVGPVGPTFLLCIKPPFLVK
jgi:hypothetical protein